VRKLLFSLMLAFMSILYVHQAVAQKESHKDYADLKISECNDCHKTEGIAPNHGSDWVSGHRVLASKAVKNCEQCHNQKFCLDCHSGGGTGDDLTAENFRSDYKPKSHRSDWIDIHGMKSVDNPQTCTRCHDQRYCTDCHSRFPGGDLKIKSHRSLGSSGQSYGTSFPSSTWGMDHSMEARRNLQSCQSCHPDGDVCIQCHRSGGVNPHPRNWGSIRGVYSERNARTCFRCHTTIP
jgi:hypothetical protein